MKCPECGKEIKEIIDFDRKKSYLKGIEDLKEATVKAIAMYGVYALHHVFKEDDEKLIAFHDGCIKATQAAAKRLIEEINKK